MSVKTSWVLGGIAALMGSHYLMHLCLPVFSARNRSQQGKVTPDHYEQVDQITQRKKALEVILGRGGSRRRSLPSMPANSEDILGGRSWLQEQDLLNKQNEKLHPRDKINPQADVLSEMTLAVQPGLHDILLEKEDLEERDDRSLLNGDLDRLSFLGDNGCTPSAGPCSTSEQCPGKDNNDDPCVCQSANPGKCG
eukprot:gnl/MRDRNA2_/MRDRNA2_86417_c0_seq8.p1 gnl/MRDRNA2_/MRDRNA2_86417_c0~~gnl/MRDRNA2_/MRDRNA2_86417_c0_seq8.p1  ORF type:complete len:215 (+),score=32.55 gnl/MRDRNA2_/MRDRNA2_86417_c0_seq8:63-647(+)